MHWGERSIVIHGWTTQRVRKKAHAFQDGEVPIMPIQTDKPRRSLNQVDIECNLQGKKCKTGQCGGIVLIYHERELDSDPDLFFPFAKYIYYW